MNDNAKTGKIYLVPSGLGSENLDIYLTPEIRRIIHDVDIFIVENIRSAVKFLQKAGINKRGEEMDFCLISGERSKNRRSGLAGCMDEVRAGKTAAIISEAGSPCVADPGAIAVALAHRNGIRVIPLAGASSIVLALMASGLNGQTFTFRGYLPKNNPERRTELTQIQNEILSYKRTQIFIEAPHRNTQLLQEIVKVIREDIHLCVAEDLTLSTERIRTLLIRDWKSEDLTLKKSPVVFLLGRASY